MYLEDEKFNYFPTHVNLDDQSTAMRVFGIDDDPNALFLINEDGYIWLASGENWTRIEPSHLGLIVKATFRVA